MGSANERPKSDIDSRDEFLEIYYECSPSIWKKKWRYQRKIEDFKLNDKIQQYKNCISRTERLEQHSTLREAWQHRARRRNQLEDQQRDGPSKCWSWNKLYFVLDYYYYYYVYLFILFTCHIRTIAQAARRLLLTSENRVQLPPT
jgi:hypothetical protein